jgi:hypothetical protein
MNLRSSRYKKYIRILAFSMLVGFSYNFLHSELGIFSIEDGKCHIEHDYCNLVQTTTVKDINHLHTVLKIKPVCIVIPFKIDQISTNNLFPAYIPEPFHINLQDDKPVYLQNRIFLI